jgi:ATP-dependent Clp protease ATP-binding subunit ClpA
MARLLQEKLKKALAEDILFGELSGNGGDVYVSVKDDDISLKIKGRQQQVKKELSKAEK